METNTVLFLSEQSGQLMLQAARIYVTDTSQGGRARQSFIPSGYKYCIPAPIELLGLNSTTQTFFSDRKNLYYYIKYYVLNCEDKIDR